MTGTCKFCGQQIILPDGEKPENAFLYCGCPDAVSHAQADVLMEDGRNAIESLCGQDARLQGLPPVPDNVRFLLLAALPAVVMGDINAFRVKLSGENDVIKIKMSKGTVGVIRQRSKQWEA